jgi:hypothetical protein
LDETTAVAEGDRMGEGAADEVRTGAAEDVVMTGAAITSGAEPASGKLGMTALMATSLSVSPEGVIPRR